MTSISLHEQWPLTAQLHGSSLKENNFLSRIKPYVPEHLCLDHVWQTGQLDGPLREEELDVRGRRLRRGTDLMKLRFGRKRFGQIFIQKIGLL
jgi:hypothetical protein